MEINKENIISAYNSADENGKRMLIALFGEEAVKQEDNRPVTERIKTFEDACRELGEEHPLLDEYTMLTQAPNIGNVLLTDLVAYLKLRIIAAALNERWEPEFTEDEWRYFPYFFLYTQEKIDKMDEEQKHRVVCRGCYNAVARGCVACAYAYHGVSHSGAYIGSRLAFKSRELATYAGEQFLEIWADFVFKAR